ncbi:MAG: hypothetical protein WCO84_01750 [bacterium]
MIGDFQKNSVQTSFIPKKPLTSSGVIKEKAGFSGVLNFISIIIFITTLSVYGGAYVYKATLDSSIAGIKSDLAKVQSELENKNTLMTEMIRFDSKLKTIGSLLDGHITLRNLFGFLEESTIKDVRYNDFKYTNKDNQSVDLKLSGESLNYSSIALQVKEFNASKKTGDKDFTNVIFSDLNPSLTGNVVFKASASVKPDLVFYKNLDGIKNSI